MQDFPGEHFGNEVELEMEDEGRVAVIRLNAPERMNTMSRRMNTAVQVALDLAQEDPKVRCVVLTGAGPRAFCAGGNLGGGADSASTGFMGSSEDVVPPTVVNAARTLRLGMSSSESLRSMDKITIAAINGACAGAGLSWALACDLRFCSDNAVFRTAFATAGLSGDYGGTWTLPRVVGAGKARELYLLNQKISATDAERISLVSAVFPQAELMDQVLSVARQIAAGPELALRRIKQNLNDGERLSFGDALDNEADRFARTAMHPDTFEAAASFLEKRKPEFDGIGETEPWMKSKL